MVTKVDPQEVIELRRKNPCFTLAHIGSTLGVTRERVRQILKKHNLRTTNIKWQGGYNTCPECGGRKGYGAVLCRKCSKHQHWVTILCQQCGKPKQVEQWELMARVRQTKSGKKFSPDLHYFCSKACFHQWQRGKNFRKEGLK